jgi:DNA-binding Lrp family transcriptional regulator
MEDNPKYITDALEMAGIDLDKPKQIVQEVSGFTPLFDAVIEKYQDETRAAVHGAVWRYCQMEDGVCKASLNKIAERVGVDVSTVSRHMESLVADGYFVDLTPDLRNRPHVYAETGKVVMRSSLTAGIAQSKASVAERNTGIAQNKASVAESRMNKDSKKDSRKDSKRRGASATPKTSVPKAKDFPSNVLFHEVTERWPAKANWHTVLKHIDGVTQRIGRTPTKDDLFPFYEAWCGNGWNTQSINWLEYAVRGELPRMNPKQAPAQPKGFEAGRQFLELHGVTING